MTAWLISQAWPYALGLVALLGVYWRGRYNGTVKARRDTMEGLAKAAKKRLEIEDAIDQDTDLVARATRAGVVRHTER